MKLQESWQKVIEKNGKYIVSNDTMNHLLVPKPTMNADLKYPA